MRSPLRIFVLRIGWEFANTLLLLASLVALYLVASTPWAHAAIQRVGEWGYVGVLLTGTFSVSTFTVAPAYVVLYSLAHLYPAIPLTLTAAFGAMLGDYLLFRFVRDRLVEEWSPLFSRLATTPFGRLFSSPFFAWLTPVVGALLIASPLPDEVGIGLLGISRLKSWKVLLLTFTLNIVGIFLVVLAAKFL